MLNCINPMENIDSQKTEKPKTSLQENYIVIDPFKPSNTIKKNGNMSPDFGYNSISKRNGFVKDLRCTSVVKKSDTFKVIDGGDTIDNDTNFLPDYKDMTNEDIARDYLRRVYELLRQRQREAKILEDALYKDTSSSNCCHEDEVQSRRRRRRRKMDRSNEGN